MYRWVTLRARWVTLRARWVTCRRRCLMRHMTCGRRICCACAFLNCCGPWYDTHPSPRKCSWCSADGRNCKPPQPCTTHIRPDPRNAQVHARRGSVRVLLLPLVAPADLREHLARTDTAHPHAQPSPGTSRIDSLTTHTLDRFTHTLDRFTHSGDASLPGGGVRVRRGLRSCAGRRLWCVHC
jgi:hypothetical protein